MIGWTCPSCGRGVSPKEKSCPCYSPRPYRPAPYYADWIYRPQPTYIPPTWIPIYPWASDPYRFTTTMGSHTNCAPQV